MALAVVVLTVLAVATGAWADCLSKPATGLCQAYFPRYFYNVSSGLCEHFVYGGCGGNKNNYHSLTECENACVHLTEEDCTAEPEVGMCRAAFPAFYFDQKTGSCKEFIYGGCGGNKNNFGDEQECLNKCAKFTKKALTLEECHAKPETGMCRAYIPSFFFNPKTGQCESFVYGGCGGNTNNFGSVEECQGQCGKFALAIDPVAPEVLCTEEPEIGMCKALIPRYFFNHHLGYCQPFFYGGCGGNTNNFETAEECRSSCHGTPQELVDCAAKPESGVCMAYFPSYFHNSTSGQCEEFVYGGCGGNSNRFTTIKSCQATCIEKMMDRRSVGVCAQEKIVGPCRAAIPRFYFDAQTKTCQKFLYGGCGGNENNFGTQEECHNTCKV